jgi:hypothetical protein
MKPAWIRRSLLLLALLATLAAAWWAPEASPDAIALDAPKRFSSAPTQLDLAATTPRASRQQATSATNPDPDVLRIRPRSDATDDWATLFATPPAQPVAPTPPPPVQKPQPVAPVAAVPAPPPPPAPPPFKVLGRYQDAQQTAVFLQGAEQTWVAHVGDTIAQTYQVESIEGQTLRLKNTATQAVHTLDLDVDATDRN